MPQLTPRDKLAAHSDTTKPLDFFNTPREELLKHMSVHELRMMQRSLRKQQEAVTNLQSKPEQTFFAPKDRRDIKMPKLHTPRSKAEVQSTPIGSDIPNASQVPVFGKKRCPTVDDHNNNALAGCFVVGPPNPPKRPAKLTPRDLDPISHHQPEWKEEYPGVRSMSPTRVKRGFFSPMGPNVDTDILQAALKPRRFEGDSAVFGEVVNEIPKRKVGKARAFNPEVYGIEAPY